MRLPYSAATAALCAAIVTTAAPTANDLQCVDDYHFLHDGAPKVCACGAMCSGAAPCVTDPKWRGGGATGPDTYDHCDETGMPVYDDCDENAPAPSATDDCEDEPASFTWEEECEEETALASGPTATLQGNNQAPTGTAPAAIPSNIPASLLAWVEDCLDEDDEELLSHEAEIPDDFECDDEELQNNVVVAPGNSTATVGIAASVTQPVQAHALQAKPTSTTTVTDCDCTDSAAAHATGA